MIVENDVVAIDFRSLQMIIILLKSSVEEKSSPWLVFITLQKVIIAVSSHHCTPTLLSLVVNKALPVSSALLSTSGVLQNSTQQRNLHGAKGWLTRPPAAFLSGGQK